MNKNLLFTIACFTSFSCVQASEEEQKIVARASLERVPTQQEQPVATPHTNGGKYLRRTGGQQGQYSSLDPHSRQKLHMQCAPVARNLFSYSE